MNISEYETSPDIISTLDLADLKYVDSALEAIAKNIPIISTGVSFGSPFSYLIAAHNNNINGIIYCYGLNYKHNITIY